MTFNDSEGILDFSTLLAISEALRKNGAPEVEIVDSLLAKPGIAAAPGKGLRNLTESEVFRIFSALIRIEWEKGKGAQYGKTTITTLVTVWKQTLVDTLGTVQEEDHPSSRPS